MSLLQYGPLSMNFVRCHRYTRQAVYSGPNYQFHRHRLNVECVLNPGTQTNYFRGSPLINAQGNYGLPIVPVVPGARQAVVAQPQPAPGIPLPPIARNVPAVSSDAAIRHMLLQPRQTLVYSILGAPILMSPLPGFTTDCSGGPFPQSCEVVEIGPRTYHIHFDIQTDVNETTQYRSPGNLPVILSHSWSMEQVIDDKWFSARVVEGKVTFRMDLLRTMTSNGQQLVPDDFRYLLFHPVVPGTRREFIQVRAEDDGCTVSYKLVDREYTQGWPDPNISFVDAEHLYAAGVAEFLGFSRLDLTKPFTLLDLQPVNSHTIKVKAVGNNLVTTNYVERFCLRILNARYAGIQLAWPGVYFGGWGIKLHHFFRTNTVEGEAKFVGPPVDIDTPPFATNFTRIGSDQTVDFTGAQPVILLGQQQLPPAGPPDDRLSRGTLLERIVGSALQAPNSGPDFPVLSPGWRVGGGFGKPGPAFQQG